MIGDEHVHLGGAQPIFDRRPAAQVEAFQPEEGQPLAQGCLRQAGVQQGAQNHVAAGAGDTVKIGDFHFSPHTRRKMRCAYSPAPKPLSMLTTATPGAQEFSIERRGANPLKLAP